MPILFNLTRFGWIHGEIAGSLGTVIIKAMSPENAQDCKIRSVDDTIVIQIRLRYITRFTRMIAKGNRQNRKVAAINSSTRVEIRTGFIVDENRSGLNAEEQPICRHDALRNGIDKPAVPLGE